MNKSKFTAEQVVFALKLAELGVPVMDVCHKLDISYATFYIWRKKYRGISLSELKHMRQNQRLNKRITNLMPDKAMPQDELASHERKDEGNGHSKR